MLGAAHHSAYVVESIEATAKQLARQFGAGPFLLIENVPLEAVESGGQPARFEHHSAFGSFDGYPIELQQVIRAEPELVREHWAAPHPRLQHVGYALDPAEVEQARSALVDRGLPEVLSSRLNGQTTTVHDGTATLGHDVEILVDGPELEGFFGMVLAAADGWDGSDVVRPVG